MKIKILFLILFFVGGCHGVKKEKYPKENISQYNYLYEKEKHLLVPECFFSHFPTKMYAPFFSQIVMDDMAKYRSYLFALCDCNIVTLKHIKKDLSSKYKSYSATDSTLLVVKDRDDYAIIKERLVKGDILLPFFSEKILSPIGDIDIPNFYSPETSTGLSPNFEIFIIENKSIYNSTEHEKRTIFQQIPTTKNEAFSRGICINLKSRYVIYWTMFF